MKMTFITVRTQFLQWVLVVASTVLAFKPSSRQCAKARIHDGRIGISGCSSICNDHDNGNGKYRNYRNVRPPASSSLLLLFAMTTESFDFSEPSKWDNFYKQNEDCYEWHASIPLERISTYIPAGSHCLMVGCGNSQLPQAVLDFHHERPPRLVLLDTSETCLDQLRQIHGSSVDYVCGDATQLSTLLLLGRGNVEKSQSQHQQKHKLFDIIVDKGLTDAILCGEGWNGPLEKLLEEASLVLDDSGCSKYLLISYRLPSSTKEFLKEVGASVGLEWEFDLPPDTNPRVGISIATKRKKEGEGKATS
jgi:hypothetical protein